MRGIAKDELYSRALQWVNKTYRSGKDVIQSADKDEGVIQGKGVMKLSLPADDWINYTFYIAVKDGRFKYSFSDLYHEGFTEGGPRNGGLLTNEKPDCGGFRMTSKYWKKIKSATGTMVGTLVNDFKENMQRPSITGTDDW